MLKSEGVLTVAELEQVCRDALERAARRDASSARVLRAGCDDDDHLCERSLALASMLCAKAVHSEREQEALAQAESAVVALSEEEEEKEPSVVQHFCENGARAVFFEALLAELPAPLDSTRAFGLGKKDEPRRRRSLDRAASRKSMDRTVSLLGPGGLYQDEDSARTSIENASTGSLNHLTTLANEDESLDGSLDDTAGGVVAPKIARAAARTSPHIGVHRTSLSTPSSSSVAARPEFRQPRRALALVAEVRRFNAVLAECRATLREPSADSSQHHHQQQQQQQLRGWHAVRDRRHARRQLLAGRVPPRWAELALAESPKRPLDWIAALASKVEYLRVWQDAGAPLTLRLGALLRPRAYLEAALLDAQHELGDLAPGDAALGTICFQTAPLAARSDLELTDQATLAPGVLVVSGARITSAVWDTTAGALRKRATATKTTQFEIKRSHRTHDDAPSTDDDDRAPLLLLSPRALLDVPFGPAAAPRQPRAFSPGVGYGATAVRFAPLFAHADSNPTQATSEWRKQTTELVLVTHLPAVDAVPKHGLVLLLE